MVDEREGIASVFLHLVGPADDVGLHRAVADVLEAVRTGLLIGESGAHPRLDVAHLEPERLPPGAGNAGVEVAHLAERAADLVDGVAEVGEAVVEGGGGAGVGGGAVVGLAGDVGDVGGHVLGLGEAHGDGGAGELSRVPTHGGGVAGERGEADVRVERRAAACTDEICAVGCVRIVGFTDG
ncbi:hypothetical protein TorRG33x02_168510 [Trema orientale]|uniref:Uncharacterized protein n=1 Tax=Trema orientale TaxID=63057 RepID=A0A2P5EPC4_TREOI|nr:hypothetical protein TorRG33x02_168510 [Trema orientale]